MLAISTPDYPVTPSDVYRITYVRLSQIVSIEGIVSSDYSLNLSLFGSINVKGLTYPQLVSRLERLVLSSYPGSKPQVVLQSTGIYQVLVKGEVENADFVQCWGLSRVSEVLAGRTTHFSSLRTVTVVSSSGNKRRCDLFLSGRTGDMEQDPYVKPQDTIIVSRAKRKIAIAGAVHRPGTYELLDSENLNEAVELLAGGFTYDASPSEIVVKRPIGGGGAASSTYYINASGAKLSDFTLENSDEIVVPSTLENLSYVFFEGALDKASPQAEALVKLSGRLGYRITAGELLSSAVRSSMASFSDLALFEDAYIVREGEKDVIPVNIEAILASKPDLKDVPLMPGDRIVIPIRQYFVTVSGAVLQPGRYPYIPNRSYLYYISGAGGFDAQRNAGGAVTILDAKDSVVPQDRIIQPEDRINAEVNNLGYFINQWVPVITMTVSLASLAIAVSPLLK